jgi:hypothetical protein
MFEGSADGVPGGTTLEAGYIQMAADEISEREALEWANSLIGDVADDPV